MPLFLLALLCPLIALAGATASMANEAAHIGVIDAGSSGSRLYVYRVNPQGDKADDLFDVSSTTAALSTFAAAPEKAGAEAVAPLLAAAEAKLAERGVSKSDVEIDLLATGGMRLLDPAAAQAIHASARRAIEERGFKAGRVETISGEMEGFYAWLDVNALMGSLAPGKRSFGIVEIGGASVQIAYAGAPASGPGIVRASFQGQDYDVRSLSFLGLGADEARKGMLAAQGEGVNSCNPTGLDADDAQRKTLRGAFDPARCEAAFLSVIKAQQGAAAIRRDEIAQVKFIGLGRPLTAVLADWRLGADAAGALRGVAQDKCAASWNEIASAHPDNPYAQFLCANAIYLSTLLFLPQALGLDANQITAVDRINNRRPSWTRGAALMLHQAR